MKTIVDYAQKVKEQHALNKTLAPVETDLTSASQAYAVGQKFIYDGVLYQAKTAIAQGAALVLNTNYEAADDVSTEIEALTNQIKDMNNVLGSKNLLPNKATSQTINGITFTVNDDGSVTANGTATRVTELPIINENLILNEGNYILSTKNNIPTNVYFSIYITGQGWKDITNGLNSIEFSKNSNIQISTCRLYIANGETVSDLTFYPMIRLASITDDTYEPYAKTNQELTAENQTLTQNINDKFVFDAVVTSVNVATLVTDTLADLGTKFYVALNALKASLESDEIIELTNFSVAGFGALRISTSSAGVISSTSALASGYHFNTMDSEASKLNIRELSLGNGAGNASLTTIATGTPSGTINRVYYDGTHIFGGTNNYLNYRKYKKISVI